MEISLKKEKGKVVSVHAIKAYRDSSRGTAPLILKFNARCR
jgi:hypothetical protein